MLKLFISYLKEIPFEKRKTKKRYSYFKGLILKHPINKTTTN
jgi:hypothetical protein